MVAEVTDIMVCTDCLMVIANDDTSSLDYSLSEEDAAAREADIRAGINELQKEMGGHICSGDSERDDTFATTSCDTCGAREHGSRHHCQVVSLT